MILPLRSYKMRFSTYILILVLSAPFVYKCYVVGHYFYFQDYYASELCEKKDEPEQTCNGSCQLRKELNASENNGDSPANPRSLSHVEISSFIVPEINHLALRTNYLARSKKSFSFTSSLDEGYCFEWIDPPRV